MNHLAFAPPEHREKAELLTAMEDLAANFPGPKVNLDAMAREITDTRLQKIAALVRQLTYGEMIEFAAALWKEVPPFPPEEKDLPAMFHRWSAK